MNDGPRRVSDREVPVSITGHFMPTHAPNVPVLIGMPGTDDLFVFLFSTEEKLRATMAAFEISYARIACVTSGKELVDEINATNASGDRSYRIRIAVDPYKADNGRVRYLELAPIDPPNDEGTPSGSALATMEHAGGCKVVRENGVAVWMCVGECPAMYEFIRSGQVDQQSWDQLDPGQIETVKRVVADHALGALDARDEEDKR